MSSSAIDWRKSLTAGRCALQQQYRKKANATQLLSKHSQLVDQVLADIWRQTNLPATFTLVAVGGYGRRELYPISDIDVLILLPDHDGSLAASQLELLISTLWDIGLEIGHSVRTIGDCLDEAKKDITVQTNLIESRWIAGNRLLFDTFSHAVHTALNPMAFFEAKLLEQKQRHQRFHGSAYNLEPNIKESPGGLRDLQNILWLSRALAIGNDWRQLTQAQIITDGEAQQLRRHELFLQNLRIRLHYLAKRREDRLLFDYQTQLAADIGLTDKTHRLASERLMQRYYRTAKAVNLINELALIGLRNHVFPSITALPAVLDDFFQARNGLLEMRDTHLFQTHPGAMLQAFLVLQRHPGLEGINAKTLRAMWRAKDQINATFRANLEMRGKFIDILRQPRKVTHTLRRMNRYGVLGRYIPAFNRITGQMQHDLFHVYTVDEHTLFVVRNLRRFTVPEFAHEFPLCSQLISSFERQELLIIAALFHDIAKGRGGDHSQLGSRDAGRFCRQHGLSEEDTALVCWLVESHLIMSATAQKQDIDDPEVIATFSRLVENGRRLTALYLLTVADIRGTSPTVWNAWKAKLLEDLFLTTHRYLHHGQAALFGTSRQRARQSEALSILRQHAIAENAPYALWKQLDASYFLRNSAEEIAWHGRILHGLTNSSVPIVKARVAPMSAGIQVLIYTRDNECLFARLCSFFERIDFNIVEAKIHTTSHGFALDSFMVLDEMNRAKQYRDLLNYIEHELTLQLQRKDSVAPPLQGRISRHLKHFPMLPDIKIAPDEKGQYQILSITAGDRPGLLSHIARLLAKHHMSLHMAKIITLGERIEDTFLVTDMDGELANSKKARQLESDLLEILQTEETHRQPH